MPGIPDPNSPLSLLSETGGPPDLTDIIDRYVEGDLDPSEAPPEEEPQMSVDRAPISSSGQSANIPLSSAIGPDGFIRGRAAEFATQQDLNDYAKNHSLRTGDPGIGAFGHRTSGDQPFVAIPRDWLEQKYGSTAAANGRPVEVISPNGSRAIFPIGDVGPRTGNRANNAVIEVNPAAKRVLGSGDAGGYSFRFLD